MKVAIVGSGISGSVVAHHLQHEHDVTVFEANDYVGGHTHTHDIQVDGRDYAVDTGFIVFNDRTYPNFIKLLEQLQVESQPTEMTFSVTCERTGLEYRGADFSGLFAQRRNVFNFRFHRLLFDFMKFNRLATELLAAPDSDSNTETVDDFLKRNRFSSQFIEQYLLPMGSAIWSCPRELFTTFPIQFIAEFYQNHGLLSVANRPQWRVIKGGSREYSRKLTSPFHDRIRLKTPVVGVVRNEDSVVVELPDFETETFDHIVFACHSDQALKILAGDASKVETEILSAFPYEPNVATLHTQQDVLPKTRRAWASWNYFNPTSDSGKATVTYNMNILQGIQSDKTFCVTLNDDGRIRDENVLAEIDYHHPTFDVRRKAMQSRHSELTNMNRSSFCGAYWGNGFHEDGVASALAVVEAIQLADPMERKTQAVI